jgi:outer membrane protein OmpA-like peptidoglycan-associated protein
MIVRFISCILFCFALAPAHAQRATDSFKLYFDLNVPTLSKSMENKIDLLIFNDKILAGSKVKIVGYADYLGTEGYNKDLSMKRAQNVKTYLVKYGINAKDIELCMGKGKIERSGLSSKDGFPKDRRVDIVVDNMSRIRKTAARPPKRDTPVNVELTNIEEIRNLRPGTTFELKNVYFPPQRHIIRPDSYRILEKLYAVLRDNPGVKISIEGHVCCIAAHAPDALDIDTNEPALSVNRAREIYDYLVGKGIDAQRLTYAGFGKRHPIIKIERTEEEAQKNRRVEIRIVENRLSKN